jgi:hypothetical protein
VVLPQQRSIKKVLTLGLRPKALSESAMSRAFSRNRSNLIILGNPSAVSSGRKAMAGNVQSANDRRERQRFGINAPLTMILGKREIAGFTRDLSNQGVYFFLDMGGIAPLGGEIEFLVELPPEITLSTCCTIRCQGRVVRRKIPHGN